MPHCRWLDMAKQVCPRSHKSTVSAQHATPGAIICTEAHLRQEAVWPVMPALLAHRCKQPPNELRPLMGKAPSSQRCQGPQHARTGIWVELHPLQGVVQLTA